MYLANGTTHYVEQGELIQNHMVGAMACPCYDIPAGTVAPVDGLWEGSQPVPAGATAPHPGRLCMSLPASNTVNLTESNICKNPMDFNDFMQISRLTRIEFM